MLQNYFILYIIMQQNKLELTKRRYIMEKGILYLAEIPYETGEIHYRYSRRMSDDETQWIRDGLFTEYYQNGNLEEEEIFEE